ncbi:MAG: hypothetical protein ACC645_24550 [Pirellulales bacterium]
MPAAELPQDAVEAALELAAFLTSENHPYAFGDALALGFWAAPRGTVDVDVTLYVSHEEPSECLSILDDAKCDFDRNQAFASLQEHGFCRVRYRGYQLDVFLPTIPFYEEARSRRKCVTLAGQPIMIWDSETLCVFKMMFFRLKDLADVQQIIQVQGSHLDRGWVLDRIVALYGQRDPRVARWAELVAGAATENGKDTNQQ